MSELAGKAHRTSPKVHRRNFDDRCRANGLAARENDRTFGMRAPSRTLACIYRQGLGRWKIRVLGLFKFRELK